jgi:hypothetical protein
MGSKMLNRILILVAPALFLVALVVLYQELKVYHLKDILQNLKEFSAYQIHLATNFMSWEKIDNRSFVLQTSPNHYYLIILSSPSDRLLFGESIK